MTINRIAAIIGAAILLASLMANVANAQETATLTSKYTPVYFYDSNGARFYNGPVVQSDLFVTWKSGVYADIWTSTAGNTRLDFDKEIDVTIGYAGKVGRLNYKTELLYFVVKDGDVLDLNTEVSLGFVVSPFIRVELYKPVENTGPKQGTILNAGLRSSFKIAPRTTLSLEVTAHRDSGAFGYDRADILSGYIGLAVAVTDRTSLLVGVTPSHPLSVVRDGRKDEAVWEVGFSRRFGGK